MPLGIILKCNLTMYCRSIWSWDGNQFYNHEVQLIIFLHLRVRIERIAIEVNGRPQQYKTNMSKKLAESAPKQENCVCKKMVHQLMSYLRESLLHWCRCHLSDFFLYYLLPHPHRRIIRLLLILISSPLSICTIDNYTRIQFNDCAICCYKQENSHRYKKKRKRKEKQIKQREEKSSARADEYFCRWKTKGAVKKRRWTARTLGEVSLRRVSNLCYNIHFLEN